MKNEKSVRLKSLVKEFIAEGKQEAFRAVDSIDLDIPAGSFVTLLGPSGCGKTTTLRMIAGFEDVSSGEVYIGDELVNELRADKRDTTMVFQTYALFPHFNVMQNISYGLKMKKMNNNDMKEKAKEIIRLVGLDGLEARYPNQLSGGQQQRVALARALVMEPGVLLFDEPLSNLDAKLRVVMRKEIRRIQQSLGLTSIYVTHDQAEAMSLSDIIIIMNKGEIEQIGSPMEIYKYPKSEFVADFIGVANFVLATVKEVREDACTVKFENMEMEISKSSKMQLEPGETVKLVIRPEAIRIDKEGEVMGKILSSTYMGATQEYLVQIGEIELRIEESNPNLELTFHVDDEVGLRLDRKNIHILKEERE
jgi:iron(III) transport system ATP-binding protein